MIKIITTSPQEAEIYAFNSKINNSIDAIGGLFNDLTTDQNVDLDILLTVIDPDRPEEFGLAIGGSTLSLEFFGDRIDVVDFNEGDEIVLETFPLDEEKQAAQWVYNSLT